MCRQFRAAASTYLGVNFLQHAASVTHKTTLGKAWVQCFGLLFAT